MSTQPHQQGLQHSCMQFHQALVAVDYLAQTVGQQKLKDVCFQKTE